MNRPLPDPTTDGRPAAASCIGALLLLVVVGCSRSEPAPAHPSRAADVAKPARRATPALSAVASAPPRCRRLGVARSPVVAGLQAEILVLDCGAGPASDILLNGRITNVSDAAVRLDRRALRFAMLVFDVRDATGAIVPGGPPPVPPADGPEQHIELRANADYIWDAALSDVVVAASLVPGPYEVRLTYESVAGPSNDWAGRLETGWVRLVWRAATP